nr:immunoglobulin heavy chain junction region [Macaca mulatta]
CARGEPSISVFGVVIVHRFDVW